VDHREFQVRTGIVDRQSTALARITTRNDASARIRAGLAMTAG